jgi:hypothetical protein
MYSYNLHMVGNEQLAKRDGVTDGQRRHINHTQVVSASPAGFCFGNSTAVRPPNGWPISRLLKMLLK